MWPHCWLLRLRKQIIRISIHPPIPFITVVITMATS